MFNWLPSIPNPNKRKLSVHMNVWYDLETAEFIVGYSFTRSITNIGIGKSLEKALEDLSEEVSTPHGTRSDRTTSERIRGAEELPLEMSLYYLEDEEQQHIEIEDPSGTTQTAVGQRTSETFANLAENIQSVNGIDKWESKR
jgi:hypothetical protein